MNAYVVSFSLMQNNVIKPQPEHLQQLGVLLGTGRNFMVSPYEKEIL